MPLRPIDWSRRAEDYRHQPGQWLNVECRSGGSPHPSLYGTDTYSTDSSICSAAAHVGVITAQEGGVVWIQFLEGQASYQGSSRHGVVSRDYGEWRGSFRVESD